MYRAMTCIALNCGQTRQFCVVHKLCRFFTIKAGASINTHSFSDSSYSSLGRNTSPITVAKEIGTMVKEQDTEALKLVIKEVMDYMECISFEPKKGSPYAKYVKQKQNSVTETYELNPSQTFIYKNSSEKVGVQCSAEYVHQRAFEAAYFLMHSFGENMKNEHYFYVIGTKNNCQFPNNEGICGINEATGKLVEYIGDNNLVKRFWISMLQMARVIIHAKNPQNFNESFRDTESFRIISACEGEIAKFVIAVIRSFLSYSQFTVPGSTKRDQQTNRMLQGFFSFEKIIQNDIKQEADTKNQKIYKSIYRSDGKKPGIFYLYIQRLFSLLSSLDPTLSQQYKEGLCDEPSSLVKHIVSSNIDDSFFFNNNLTIYREDEIDEIYKLICIADSKLSVLIPPDILISRFENENKNENLLNQFTRETLLTYDLRLFSLLLFDFYKYIVINMSFNNNNNNNNNNNVELYIKHEAELAFEKDIDYLSSKLENSNYIFSIENLALLKFFKICKNRIKLIFGYLDIQGILDTVFDIRVFSRCINFMTSSILQFHISPDTISLKKPLISNKQENEINFNNNILPYNIRSFERIPHTVTTIQRQIKASNKCNSPELQNSRCIGHSSMMIIKSPFIITASEVVRCLETITRSGLKYPEFFTACIYHVLLKSTLIGCSTCVEHNNNSIQFELGRNFDNPGLGLVGGIRVLEDVFEYVFQNRLTRNILKKNEIFNSHMFINTPAGNVIDLCDFYRTSINEKKKKNNNFLNIESIQQYNQLAEEIALLVSYVPLTTTFETLTQTPALSDRLGPKNIALNLLTISQFSNILSSLQRSSNKNLPLANWLSFLIQSRLSLNTRNLLENNCSLYEDISFYEKINENMNLKTYLNLILFEINQNNSFGINQTACLSFLFEIGNIVVRFNELKFRDDKLLYKCSRFILKENLIENSCISIIRAVYNDYIVHKGYIKNEDINVNEWRHWCLNHKLIGKFYLCLYDIYRIYIGPNPSGCDFSSNRYTSLCYLLQNYFITHDYMISTDPNLYINKTTFSSILNDYNSSKEKFIFHLKILLGPPPGSFGVSRMINFWRDSFKAGMYRGQVRASCKKVLFHYIDIRMGLSIYNNNNNNNDKILNNDALCYSVYKDIYNIMPEESFKISSRALSMCYSITGLMDLRLLIILMDFLNLTLFQSIYIKYRKLSWSNILNENNSLNLYKYDIPIITWLKQDDVQLLRSSFWKSLYHIYHQDKADMKINKNKENNKNSFNTLSLLDLKILLFSVYTLDCVYATSLFVDKDNSYVHRRLSNIIPVLIAGVESTSKILLSSGLHEEVHNSLPIEAKAATKFEVQIGPHTVDEIIELYC